MSDRACERFICDWISVAVILVCVLAAGCRDVATIWSAQSRSPDGQWLAKAQTDQYGGPGTAGVYTNVSLERTSDPRHPADILTLSNETAYPLGITNVEMKWLTPSHLEVGYRGHADLDFQVVKYGGLEISVRDLSSDTTGHRHE
jgi:hypothetical protein